MSLPAGCTLSLVPKIPAMPDAWTAMIEVKDTRTNSTHVYREAYDWKLNARRIERQSEEGANDMNGTTIYAYNENKVTPLPVRPTRACTIVILPYMDT
jgi:hypothetical protein